MTKVKKKKVDVQKIIKNPKQSWSERLIVRLLQNVVIAAIFLWVCHMINEYLNQKYYFPAEMGDVLY